MKRTTIGLISLAALLIALAVLVACGSATESGDSYAAASAPAPAAMFGKSADMESAPRAMQAPAQPQAQAASAPAMPAATAAPMAVSAKTVEVEQAVELVKESDSSDGGELSDVQASSVAQNRIIVRTVQLDLEVDNVADAIDVISQNVQQAGGWVVSTDRGSTHYGFIAVRVPASGLDSALKWMRQVGVDVRSESSTSTDVTDEYYDLRSRVKSLQATEQALIKLLDRADKVEDALEVQRELARLQVEIEAHLGRIKLLEETAAFSLVNISLNLAPADMQVDTGADKTYSVGEFARFRATFMPPEGIDDFQFTWDFGDGTPPVSDRGSAPTTQPGQRITATVNHFYEDDRDSPYIVEVKITGFGEAGIAEGEDTFIATVTEVPAIVVYAGDFRMVDEGKEETYSGSFTRPEGLRNYQYKWDFGDGSPALTGPVEEGASKVETTHIFENHRNLEYTVTLTISAESDAGEVEGVSSFGVYAREVEGFVVSGWSAGDDFKSAVRALSGVAQVAGTVLIWLAIFSPVWIVLAILIVAFLWFRRRLIRSSRQRHADAEAAARQANDAPTRNNDEEERE